MTIGGAPPEAAASMAVAFRRAYASRGGTGSPRLVCLSYFGLSDEEESFRQVRAYYAFAGDRADAIAASAPRSVPEVRARVAAYADLGADELVLIPTVPDVAEVDRLADAVFS